MPSYKEASNNAKRTAALFRRMRAPAEQAELWAEELLTQWGLDRSGYTTSWRANDGRVRLSVVSGREPVDYYKLVGELQGRQLCNFMISPDIFRITKTYETAGVTAEVWLDAKVPDAVKQNLRKKGVIKETFTPGFSYETVECPVEPAPETTVAIEETADEEIPF